MILFPQDDKTKLVRNMQPNKQDYTKLARCYNSFKDSDSWPGGFGGSFVFTEEWVEDHYKDLDYETFFVIDNLEDGSKMVGVCLCNRSWEVPDSWYVGILGVDPEYQGQKYGKVLVLRATEFAMEKRARFIGLHTWGGNLKAMPLYKRQGYKWRPGTSVYCVNYIPQILNFPLSKEFFSENSWYDIFKPKITQEMDDTFEDKMAVYEYFFETESKETLNIWLDRSVGKISGFHIKYKERNLLVKVTTPNSQAFIGIEEFPFEIKLKNEGQNEESIQVTIEPTSNIEFNGEKEISIHLSPWEEKIISYTGSFVAGTEELDVKTFPQAFSNHEIKFECKIDDISFPLILGKIPKNAINVQTNPENYIIKTNKEIMLPLEIHNFLEEEKEIVVTLEGSNILSFHKSEISTKVSKYDTEIKIPINVGSAGTSVEYFIVSVSDHAGQKIITKRLPIIIFEKNKAVNYEIDQKMYIENRDIRVSYYKNFMPGTNFLTVKDKSRNLARIGFNMVLGYPIDTEGSEFYTKNVDHTIDCTEDGIWLYSSSESEKKKGIRFTRKFFVPNNDEPFGVHFKVENRSDELIGNLGVKCEYWWWQGGERVEKMIFHFKDGIKYYNFPELQIKDPNKPEDFQEGWNAVVYPEGCVGCLYDLEKIEKIEGYNIEEKIPDLNAKQTYETSIIWFYFADKWQYIQQKWRDIYLNLAEKKPVLTRKPEEFKITSLLSSKNSEYNSRGIILPKSSKDLLTSINTNKAAEFRGSIKLSFEELNTEPEEAIIEKNRLERFDIKFKLSNLERKIYSGKLIHNTSSIIYEHPISIGTFDQTKEILVKKIEKDGLTFYEVNNGFLRFKGDASYRGQIFSLSVENEDNYLKTFYPEVKPFIWTNEFFGGISGNIRLVDSWDQHSYCKLKFEGFQIQKGNWKGIGFKSEIIEYSPHLKGLQVTNEYLTLPDSPFLLYIQTVENHSEATRTCDIGIDVDIKTSETPDDEYYTEVSGKITTFKLDEFESYVWRHCDYDVKWTAYKSIKNKYCLGAAIQPSKQFLRTSVYAPNYTYSTIGIQSKRVTIGPKEKNEFKVLYILTDDVNSIGPFAKSNIKEYFEE